MRHRVFLGLNEAPTLSATSKSPGELSRPTPGSPGNRKPVNGANDMQPKRPFVFTFKTIESEFRKILDLGYRVITCADYVAEKREAKPGDARLLVNRVDIDMSVKKAERLAAMFNGLGVQATFFLRLHATEYNPFSFENYRIVRSIIEGGHELGYHSEVVDEAAIWQEDAEGVLRRDIHVMNEIFGVSVRGVASHGGFTGHNNLDFWRTRRPADFGLLYEAYDREPSFNLFHESLYVSDSNWTYWKSYENGELIEGDRRSPADHAKEGRPLIYSLIHSDTYYDRHFYE